MHSSLAAGRELAVYLPPSYEAEPQRRFPVLYMQDGQNLFDAATAFLGNEWGLDELAEQMIADRQIEPLIIVGIYNAGNTRVQEYTPTPALNGVGGQASAYGKLLARRIRTFINQQYRTLTSPQHTALGGSSLGGLVSLYLGLQYPNIFGKLIVMSPSVWWADRAILKQVQKLRKRRATRIWLDTGTCEGERPQDCTKDTAELCQALVAKGWRLGSDLAYAEEEGAAHNESAWGNRMRHALAFHFPLKP